MIPIFIEDKETCNKDTQDPQGKPISKTRIEVTVAPLEQRPFPRRAVNRQTNSSKSLSSSNTDTDKLIRSTKYTRQSKSKEKTRIPPMSVNLETPVKETSDLNKRKSPGTPGTEFSPQTENSKHPRFMSPPKEMDKPPGAQSAQMSSETQGRTGYIKAVRAKHDWKDIGLDACMLRQNVSKQLSTFNREPKKFSKTEIENKARVEFCKMEWMISRELHQTYLDHMENTKKDWVENINKKTHHADNLTKGLKVLHSSAMKDKEPHDKFHSRVGDLIDNLKPELEEFNCENQNDMVQEVLNALKSRIVDAFGNQGEITNKKINTQFWDEKICHSDVISKKEDFEDRILTAGNPSAKNALEYFARGILEVAFLEQNEKSPTTLSNSLTHD